MWEVPRSTVYATKTRRTAGRPAQRRGPPPRWSDAALLEQIQEVLAATPFVGEGHRKVWARLRVRHVRTSKARVLRLMRAAGLLAPTRVGHAHGPAAHDGTILTERPDEMWGTDATSCFTRGEGSATVFIAVDHCSAECMGIHTAKYGSRFEALEPIRQGVPEGNGCAERFIRTLKEQLLWVRTFDTVEELRLALLEFKARYHREWLIERHGHQTPAAVRAAFTAAVDAAA